MVCAQGVVVGAALGQRLLDSSTCQITASNVISRTGQILLDMLLLMLFVLVAGPPVRAPCTPSTLRLPLTWIVPNRMSYS
jgi:hypothetical protein